MKKYKKILLGGAVGLAIAAIIILLFVFRSENGQRLPYLQKEAFKMSRIEAIFSFGIPERTEFNGGDGGATVSYEYTMEIKGKPARMVLTFVSSGLGKKLYKANTYFSDLEEQEAKDLYCEIAEELIAANRDEPGYSVRNTGKEFTISISEGAEGIQYIIKRNDNEVVISSEASF